MNRTEWIDNSAFLPKIRGEDAVTLEPCEPDGRRMTPDWVKSLILMEVHIETATKEGTFASAIRVLDHCAEMGVNGIWLTPIYEKGPGGNGYGNCGPHTVEPALTGTQDPAEGWLVVRDFVREAHKRNIRVLLDIITWGTVTGAPLYREHPDWYNGEAWGNQAFDWKNSAFVDWFTDVAIRNILVTGADGYRCDCEPNYTGYDVFNRIRVGCLAAGRKILVIAEDGCERRDCFDMEQDGVLFYKERTRGEQYQNPKNFYLSGYSVIDAVKSGDGHGKAELQAEESGGRYRFYTYCVSNHDYQYSVTNGNRLAIGYQAIFAPYIPLWYFGAEFGMRAEQRVIYFDPVKWENADLPEIRAFYEDVKAYIRIRRRYPAIFEYFPDDHRNANICALETAPRLPLPAYVRYRDGEAVAVIANDTDTAVTVSVGIPCDAAGIRADAVITDLLTGTEIPSEKGIFTVTVAGGHIGVYHMR